MALPPITDEQRAEALAKAVANRKERTELLTQLKNGTLSLAELLEREDQVVGRISVRRLLEGLPGIGLVKAEQLRSELGISSRRRVQGLGPRQREALLQRFPADT
ncbi:integration host factor, actinobacterial type [Streptomyces sp. NPDC019539]|uniref:integration host factor, actinobacterial type n=1 Tax=Streptomyces sp. NPDC019539 TaxID=3365063 RepID=UPI0037AE8D01